MSKGAKTAQRAAFMRAGQGMLTCVTATLLVAGGAASPALAGENESQLVTQSWQCDDREEQRTDLSQEEGTAQDFIIPRFGDTGLNGTFKRVEISQSMDLRDWGVLNFHHNPAIPTAIKVSVNNMIWMNLPPYPVTSFPTEDSTQEISMEKTRLLFQNGAQAGGVSLEIPEVNSHAENTISSDDASQWAGAGSHELSLQTITSFDLRGGGANTNLSLNTMAKSEVCYRYIYEQHTEPPVKVSIGDYVWIDTNRDGMQGATEAPLSDVTVNLYQADGTTPVATTTTDANGFYSFVDLDPGTKYVVEFVKPTGYSFASQNLGGDATSDSDADPDTGRVVVTTPTSGNNSATQPDDSTIDAGLLMYNLLVKKSLATEVKILPGDDVKFVLTPHNEGPVDALAGWSVTDLIPAGTELKSMSGEGYNCDLESATCVATSSLKAHTDGNPIEVTITTSKDDVGEKRNIAYITPAHGDIEEANPLVIPFASTDTKSSATDNDDEALFNVSQAAPPKPKADPTQPPANALANTGAVSSSSALGISGALLGSAGLLLLARRRKVSDSFAR